MDAQVVLSDEIPRGILIAANKTKSRRIYMGVSERTRTQRFSLRKYNRAGSAAATCDVVVYRRIA